MKSTSIALNTFVALLGAFATMCAVPAHADQAAVTFLQPFVTWAETKPLGNGIYDLDFTLVSNQPSLVSSFASGALEYDEYETYVKGHWYNTKQFTLSPGQDAGQYFSDRLWNSQPNTLFGFWHPFDPFHTDQLRITLDAINGQLIYHRDSWGTTAYAADLHVLPGSSVLAGTLTIQNQPVTVLISVKEDFRQIPR